MTYTPRLAPDRDRRHYNRAGQLALRTLALEWSPVMAYVVGLMATDGCLLERRRQLNFKSEDQQLVETFLVCLGKPPTLQTVKGQTGNLHYVTQFRDADLYRWLESIGLMPRKSFALGAIDVPDGVIFDCARGLLDGDGSILNFWYEGAGKAKGKRYENLVTVFNSASQTHLEWLRNRLARSLGIVGALVPQPPTERGTVMWRLAYSIRESTRLLPHLYQSLAAPCLNRKRAVWQDYATRHGLVATLAELDEMS